MTDAWVENVKRFQIVPTEDDFCVQRFVTQGPGSPLPLAPIGNQQPLDQETTTSQKLSFLTMKRSAVQTFPKNLCPPPYFFLFESSTISNVLD